MNYKLWLIVGPSGVGKTTLVKNLVKDNHALEAISYTTRDPRPTEVDTKDYYFINKKQFSKMAKNKEFAEHVVYSNNFYGITKKEIDTKLLENHVLLVTEGEGAIQLKEIYQDKATVVFLIPESKNQLKDRLKNRQESEEVIEQRLSLFDTEMSYRYLADVELWPSSPESLVFNMILAFNGVSSPKYIAVNNLWDELKANIIYYFSDIKFIRKWYGGHWEQWGAGPLENQLVWTLTHKCSKESNFRPGVFLFKLKACECYDNTSALPVSLS